MNLFKKLTNRILIISSGFLIIIIGILYSIYLYQTENKELGCGNKTPEFVCGNASSNFSEETQKGKEIFNSNCAACHKLYKNMTGTALSNIDSTKLWNWITEKNKKADSTKFNEMKIDYHKIMWNIRLDETQLNELYKYTKTE
jgi:Cytochrome c